MNITATKNATTQTIDVVVNNDGTEKTLFHTITKVSGIDVTSGGSNADVFLSYLDTVDGSTQSTTLNVKASENGTAVITVKAHAYVPSEVVAFSAALTALWAENTAEQITAMSASEDLSDSQPTPTELTSSNITLVFDDSNGVHQFA